MIMTQRKSTRISRLILVAVICAQGILAAHACVEPVVSAVQAVTMAVSDAELMPCHTTKEISSNECLMHCTQSDQVNLDHHPMAAAPVGNIILQISVPLQQSTASTLAHTPLVLNTGPPLSIRYCTFLI